LRNLKKEKQGPMSKVQNKAIIVCDNKMAKKSDIPLLGQILKLDISKAGNLTMPTWSPWTSGISMLPKLVDEVDGI
jgi:hypothetical protein